LDAIVALILAALIFAYGQAQTPGATTTLRRIQVNAQTITALPSGKKYVADLTKRGVVYEFDSKSGRIDFNRVMVRTAQGYVAIGSFLEKKLPKDKLPSLKNTSLSLILGTRATGTVQNPLANPLKEIECPNPYECSCHGENDCQKMLDSGLCGGTFFCFRYGDGRVFCDCERMP
jgi:hypothetical protein